MLVLSRKDGEWIQIGDARIVILHASHGRVSVGVDAPREVTILRGELVEQLNVVAIDRSDADGTYILVFRDSQVSQAICALGRWADNYDLGFTWYDAAVAAARIRSTTRNRT